MSDLDEKPHYFPKKIPGEFENPIDHILISICDKICPIFHCLNFTPNMITFIGLIIGLLSVYYLYIGKNLMAFGLLWLTYFFDCLDGHYARKYNMETQFGDYFDHFRDLLIFSLLIIVLVIKAENKKLTLFYIILFIVLCLPHIGCQELHSEFKENNKLLQKFKHLCLKKEMILYTRFFGLGTFVLLLSALILNKN